MTADTFSGRVLPLPSVSDMTTPLERETLRRAAEAGLLTLEQPLEMARSWRKRGTRQLGAAV